MKFCPKCSLEKELSEFSTNRRNSDGLSCYCKKCRNDMQKVYGRTEARKRTYKRNNEKDWTKPENLYSRAKAACKQKGHVFLLTLEEYVELYKLPCYYCNNVLCGDSIKKGISLDRIDNSRGYESDNVLPCGTFCNRTRGDRMTVEEMIQIAKLIIYMRSSVHNGV